MCRLCTKPHKYKLHCSFSGAYPNDGRKKNRLTFCTVIVSHKIWMCIIMNIAWKCCARYFRIHIYTFFFVHHECLYYTARPRTRTAFVLGRLSPFDCYVGSVHEMPTVCVNASGSTIRHLFIVAPPGLAVTPHTFILPPGRPPQWHNQLSCVSFIHYIISVWLC